MLARRLGALLGIPVTHLDAMYYDEDWNRLRPGEFAERQRAMVTAEAWIMDGNYASSLPIRLAAADTVIFLDLPAWSCLLGLLRRRIAVRGGQHPERGVYDRITRTSGCGRSARRTSLSSTPAMFEQTAMLLAAHGRRQVDRKPRTTQRPYVLRGLLFCGLCDRRMQGSWNNGKAHYRCNATGQPAGHGQADTDGHPRSLYVRDDPILAPLDVRLAEAFDPDQLPDTIQAMHDSQNDQGAGEARRVAAGAARRTIKDCDERLARYHAALDASNDGGDQPATIGRWIAQAEAERAQAQQRLKQATGEQPRMSREEVQTLVAGLGNLLAVLAHADPHDKAVVYANWA